jgi:DNA-binding transcriptional ArsR family regulator
MEESQVLDQLEQVKALADPLRLRILEAFCSQGPMTTKQVAVLIGEKPTKLYHHIETLQRLQLITLVRTRKNRGTTEKYFEAAARRFSVDRRLFDMLPEGTKDGSLESMISTALTNTMEEISRSLGSNREGDDESDEMVFARFRFRSSRNQIAKIKTKIQALLSDLDEAEKTGGASGSENETQYGFTMVLYPTATENTAENTKKKSIEEALNDESSN